MTEPCHGARGENLVRFGLVLYEIVDAAIAISGADFGNIQLIDPKTSDLRIVAHRGFPEWWLDFWNSVSAGHGVCGSALACGERIIVEDVEHSPIFIGTPSLEIQRRAGVRAVQSTPIISRKGRPLGMFSTHYKTPRRPDERGLLLLDLLARQAADVIERKQAEEALEQTRDMLDEAQKIAHLGSFEYVAATQTTKWSEEEYRIYGLDPAGPSPEYDDMLARCIHPDDAALLHETFTKAMRNNGIYELEHRIVRPDGRVRWVYDRAHPYVDAGGNLLRYVGATLDITERKAAEAQIQTVNAELEKRVQERTAQLKDANEALLKSNAELKQFAYATAHDLQTPLRSIAGFTQLLQQEVQGRVSEQVDEWAATVVDNTKRLQTLIQDVLSYTRLEAQGLPLRMTDLKRLFDEVVASLSVLIEETRAEVTCSALPTLPVDRTQMAQVFQNLIENGIKYNRSMRPKVEVAGELQGDQWMFSVADNGIGIDPKHFDHVFELFKRLHPYHEFPGTGVGVPLCRRIVERHGGHMWIESRPGEGSTFYFSLPLERSEAP